MPNQVITTELTKLFGIKVPIMLAGMNVAAGPELAAAVTNAGGLGVIGGVGYTPEMLKENIKELKDDLKDKNAPFGVDLLLPQVGGNARKTNKDYTGGKLHELIDIIIAEKAKLFVSAVGIPPRDVVDKLHRAGIVVANMIGAPKHVQKALDAGVDVIIAQGGEGGGHTGDVPTSLLIPHCAELIKGKKSPLTGEQVLLVAAGGIYNGKSLAAALSFGASGVWVGTRFVNSVEAGAPDAHKKTVINTSWDDTIRTIIFTGRPLRVNKTKLVMDWENNKQDEIKRLTGQGIIPVQRDDLIDEQETAFLMGRTAAVISDIKPAKQIMDEMVDEAIEIFQRNAASVGKAKL